MEEVICCLIMLIIIPVVGIITLHTFISVPKLRNYEDIELGMSENEMLSIMGGYYNKSLLKNGRIKYEWRIGSSSYSHGNVRFYSGVHKVSIYVKNGVVEEVRPYNV